MEKLEYNYIVLHIACVSSIIWKWVFEFQRRLSIARNTITLLPPTYTFMNFKSRLIVCLYVAVCGRAVNYDADTLLCRSSSTNVGAII